MIFLLTQISFITELELLSFPKIDENSIRAIKGLIKNCRVVTINQKIKDATIEFRRTARLKIPDALIAASATYCKLPFLTADKQFLQTDSLEVIFYEV